MFFVELDNIIYRKLENGLYYAKLWEIIDIDLQNIDTNPAIAKRQIQSAVRERIDGNIDAICSTGSFSYLVNTDLFCEVETADITCLVFRQVA